MNRSIILSTFLLALWACGPQEAQEEQRPTETKATSQRVAVSLDIDSWARTVHKRPGTILDVRTPEEIAQGMVPDAINIDWRGANFKAQVFELDKDIPVHVYCASGGRSKQAMGLLKELGFQEIYELDGGFTAWKTSGKEVSLP